MNLIYRYPFAGEIEMPFNAHIISAHAAWDAHSVPRIFLFAQFNPDDIHRKEKRKFFLAETDVSFDGAGKRFIATIPMSHVVFHLFEEFP